MTFKTSNQTLLEKVIFQSNSERLTKISIKAAMIENLLSQEALMNNPIRNISSFNIDAIIKLRQDVTNLRIKIQYLSNSQKLAKNNIIKSGPSGYQSHLQSESAIRSKQLKALLEELTKKKKSLNSFIREERNKEKNHKNTKREIRNSLLKEVNGVFDDLAVTGSLTVQEVKEIQEFILLKVSNK